MFPIYLLTLLVALGAIWLFFKASEEIYIVLAATTAIVCLILGCALAPWQLQLAIVMLVLGLEWLYLRTLPTGVRCEEKIKMKK